MPTQSPTIKSVKHKKITKSSILSFYYKFIIFISFT